MVEAGTAPDYEEKRTTFLQDAELHPERMSVLCPLRLTLRRHDKYRLMRLRNLDQWLSVQGLGEVFLEDARDKGRYWATELSYRDSDGYPYYWVIPPVGEPIDKYIIMFDAYLAFFEFSVESVRKEGKALYKLLEPAVFRKIGNFYQLILEGKIELIEWNENTVKPVRAVPRALQRTPQNVIKDAEGETIRTHKQAEANKAYEDQPARKTPDVPDHKYADIYAREEKALEAIFANNWVKLLPNSQQSLVEARVKFIQNTAMEEVEPEKKRDYSSVCLHTAAPLEAELRRRFYDDYREFLSKKYSNRDEEWPKSLRDKVTGLGDICKILLPTVGKDKSRLCEYISSKWAAPMKKADLFQALEDIEKEIDIVREQYRNPAAHMYGMTREDAVNCFKKIIDEDKLFVKFLALFKK